MSRRVTHRAYARAGVLGNPSDVYQGKAIAISVADFAARVRIEASDRFAFVPGPAEAVEFADAREAWERIERVGCDDGLRLLRAALRRFVLRFPECADAADSDPSLRFTIAYETDIPRQVGLSGSSAIVIAALRALADWFGRSFEPFELAESALAAEVEELSITAGPMDRVIQAYEGAVAMDFREPRTPASYRRIDAASLPPLFVAWDPRPGATSGRVHGDVRQRWLAGDPSVRRAMEIFPSLVDEGLACLERGDRGGFLQCMDRNFDTRASIWTLTERDLRMVEVGRAHGAAVKMCGSGGAVIGGLAHVDDFGRIETAYRDAGFRTIRPTIPEPEDPASGDPT